MQHPAQIESMCDSRLHTAIRSPDRTRPRVPLLCAALLDTARRWLSRLPFHSPLEQHQAALLQASLLGALLMGGLSLVGLRQTADSWAQTFVCVAGLLVLALGLAQVRQGLLQPALNLSVLGMLLLLSAPLLWHGLAARLFLLPALLLPVVLVGTLAARRELVWVCLAVAGVVAAAMARDSLAPGGHAAGVPAALLASFALTLALMGLLARHLRATLRGLLERPLPPEQEYEQVCQTPTAALGQPEAGLEDIQPDERGRGDLGIPLQPILPGVLLAPLVGPFDNQRMLALIDQTFEQVERHRAQHVIFDLSALPLLEPASAAMLLRLPGALRHLEAELIVVGVRADVALALCRTGGDLRTLRAYRSLEEALRPLVVTYAQTWPALSYRLSADLRARTENN